jgi:putative transcriptional regulator
MYLRHYKKKAIKPEKGNLLIAEPSILNDNSFNRTIILLTEFTENNAVGFILNRPLDFTIQDLLPDIQSEFTIFEGGPVEQDNLYFVHRVPDLIPESVAVSNGIYWGGNFSVLKELLENKALDSSEIRFFLGYSGWTEQQLLNEINTDSWFVSENDFDNIFAKDNTTLWKNKLLQKGGAYKLWANAPSDFNQN